MTEHSLLESVVHITEERDKRSLGRVLIEVLADFIDFDDVILFILPDQVEPEYIEQVASIPKDARMNRLNPITSDYGEKRVYLDSSMRHCIATCAVIHGDAGGASRVLFPLVVNQKVAGVLDLYGAELDHATEKMIQGFIRIYCNFVDILDDSERDALTGLYNRKTFDAKFSDLVVTAGTETSMPFKDGEERRVGALAETYWLGILDIDRFKQINDSFGHLYGDEVLLLFSDIMRESFRTNDLLFRYGGEEFLVVLSLCSDADAILVFERFRNAIENRIFPQVGEITVSIGMTKIAPGKHPSSIIEKADKALYFAKEHGRNRVCAYEKLVADGLIKERGVADDIELF